MSDSNNRSQLIRKLRQQAKDLNRTPFIDEFLQKNKLSEWVVRSQFGSYQRMLHAAGLNKPKPTDDINTLKTIIKNLKIELQEANEELSEARKLVTDTETIRSFIGACNAHRIENSPEWAAKPKTYNNKLLGIPNLFLSDIHFDEIVDPKQIQYMNEYNRTIAIRRFKHTIQTSVDILKGKFADPVYDGFALHLGGDMLSGTIHEELTETNEDTIARSLMVLADLLISAIEYFIAEFGQVFVTGVVGNHPRFSKKPRHKNKVYDNFEWILYQFIIRYFKDEPRVKFLIPDGSDAVFSIYGTNFLLTHGDQFKGGSGISGLMAPLMLGLHRKQRRQAEINRPFDIMMIGHFHRYLHMDSLICNGSLKGYDEFAADNNFPFERPQQALFIVHPEHGITFRIPILCNSYEKTKSSNSDRKNPFSIKDPT